MTPKHRRGLLLVAFGALAWSATGLIFRLTDADVLTILSGRGLAAAGFLLFVLVLRHGTRLPRVFRRLGWPGFLVALFFAADGACYIGALHYTSVAHVVVMLSLTPLLAAVAGWLVLGERVSGPVWIGVAAALAGVGLMVSGNLESGLWQGDLIALGVPSLFAVVTVIMRRHPEVELLPAVCLASLMSGLAFLPFAHFPGLPVGALGLVLLLGIVEYGLGLMPYLAGAKRVPAAEAALMSLLETVLAPLWVWLAVGEDPGWRTIAGGAVVLAVLAGLALRDLRRPAR
jgi:drug/metabolite transporter (DMT)-like permease